MHSENVMSPQKTDTDGNSQGGGGAEPQNKRPRNPKNSRVSNIDNSLRLELVYTKQALES